MIKEKKLYMKAGFLHLGGGGFLCPCCGPSNRKNAKAMMRAARKRYARILDKVEKLEQQED